MTECSQGQQIIAQQYINAWPHNSEALLGPLLSTARAQAAGGPGLDRDCSLTACHSEVCCACVPRTCRLCSLRVPLSPNPQIARAYASANHRDFSGQETYCLLVTSTSNKYGVGGGQRLNRECQQLYHQSLNSSGLPPNSWGEGGRGSPNLGRVLSLP